MENKLEVKDLRISFRTISGKVQAVRGINFDLKEGETLAIVGESGSGKSVTSKAILGILAGNSIVEGGEIIYDGMDLLKISEDEFYKIRGDKIAMIFQDPLSSLNPIMRIGRQLTEAMLLKGKARQKSCRNAFNSYLALLKNAMVESIAKGDRAKAASLEAMCKDFDTFEFKHIALESAYNDAFNSAQEVISNLENLLFLIEKRAMEKSKRDLNETLELAIKSISTYVVNGEDENALRQCCDRVRGMMKQISKPEDYDKIVADLTTMREICQRSVEKTAPNFFALGYYYTFSKEPLPTLPVEELNPFLRKYLDDHFMLEFISNASIALQASAEKHNAEKVKAVEGLKKGVAFFRSTEDYAAAEKELEPRRPCRPGKPPCPTWRST